MKITDFGSPRSDIFSFGVITYQILPGRLPCGMQITKSRTETVQGNLRCCSALDDLEISAWIDDVLRKAVRPDPAECHGELSEYPFDLHHPNEEFLYRMRPPLAERDPVTS